MNLQILVGSDTTEIMIAGGAVPRKPAAKNRPGVISPAHQKPRPQRAPVPLLGSPCYRCSARFRSSKPGLPPGLACLPVCQPGRLTHWRPLPFFHFHPAPRRGATSSTISFLSSRAWQTARALAQETGGRESFKSVHSFVFICGDRRDRRTEGTESP